MYFHGYYVEQNYDKAFELFSEAATAAKFPSGNAMNMLSTCYRFGYGTTKDLEKADYWLKMAQETGSEEANNIKQLLEQYNMY